jgi:hypothetical protein
LPKTYVASTTGLDWLETGMRMLKTIHDMKHSRICIITGDKTLDKTFAPTGTTLHYIPHKRWVEELKRVAVNDEVRATAKRFKKLAVKTVEPNGDDLINAAKNYFVARRIMDAEKCDGISLNCLGLVRSKQIACAPCMAWSRLNDEGFVGACEAAAHSAVTLRLCSYLFQRPGFMQDPAPSTVKNTLLGAHCSCPTKLEGFDKDPEPFVLRNHHESSTGVSPQVLWHVGRDVTVVSFAGPKLICGTGRVLANVDTPTEGGCRTSVELEMDHVKNAADIRGFHQVFLYGRLDRQLAAYGKLAGIEVEPIALS